MKNKPLPQEVSQQLSQAISFDDFLTVREIFEAHPDSINAPLSHFPDFSDEASCCDGPLHLAARRKAVYVTVELLSYQGINVNVQNRDGDTPFLLLAKFDGCRRVIGKFLENKSLDLRVQNKEGRNALMEAVRCGDLWLVQDILLKKNNGIEQRDRNGIRALSHAFATNHIKIAAWLIEEENEFLGLERETGINAQDEHGDTGLMRTIKIGQVDKTLMYLDRNGLDLRVQNKMGQNALMEASRRGLLPIVEAILKKSRNGLRQVDETGQNAMMYAACAGHVEIVYLLEKAGLSTTEPSRNGMTPASFLSRRELDSDPRRWMFDKRLDPMGRAPG